MQPQTPAESAHPAGHLRRSLGPSHLWGLAVGLVISGEYFGWSYGWSAAGTLGFLVATLMVAVLYTAFIFSYTELSASMPSAGGPFTYALRALGPWGGFVAGFATLVEFVFAPPAIAFAVGKYLSVVAPSIDPDTAAALFVIAFGVLNLFAIKQSARFELVVTLLAVAELCVFMAVAGPHFESRNFLSDPWMGGVPGIFAAIPFAIWFFLGIEGVAMTSEEVMNPKRDLPIGYITGIVTLVVLALGVMLAAGGVGDWKKLSNLDFPIPAAIAMALGEGSPWTKAFAAIGLFGLIASLNGIIVGAARQVFAVARAGLLPRWLGWTNRADVPHTAVLACTGAGLLSILTGTTAQVITLSAIGAALMYVMAMASLFVLRRRAPEMERPFRAPLYPYFPAVALVLSLVSLVAIVWYNALLTLIFLGLFALCAAYFVLRGRKRMANPA
jgi:ethanolamine permease